MTEREIMAELRRCLSRVCTGRLASRMQRYVPNRLRSTVQQAVRRDPEFQRGGIYFSCYMDSDGGVQWRESTREVRLRVVIRGVRRVWENWSSTPEETLVAMGHIRRQRGGGNALDINVVCRRTYPGRLEIRGLPRRGRREGGRAVVRGGSGSIDADALQSLSRAHERARPRRQTGSLNMEEEEEALQM